eukprot:TRINITY_DN21816_c0_g1_i1.p1 TRINITY_DN21816_c0_g1~~TRINITY_DN21816_c0_g1_i1.p1  ORF type:complete len:206 (+),score=71.30 TRINITY_DN21816_c0_g1_i1:77-694(+)
MTTTNNLSEVRTQHADYASRTARDEDVLARREETLAHHAATGATQHTLMHDEKARIVAESKLRHDALKAASLEGQPLVAHTGGATVVAQGPVVEPGHAGGAAVPGVVTHHDPLVANAVTSHVATGGAPLAHGGVAENVPIAAAVPGATHAVTREVVGTDHAHVHGVHGAAVPVGGHSAVNTHTTTAGTTAGMTGGVVVSETVRQV